jgi:hypothetical protein
MAWRSSSGEAGVVVAVIRVVVNKKLRMQGSYRTSGHETKISRD